jgi:hypothetical protein
LRFTLNVGVMKPFSTDYGVVTTTRHSSRSCGSSCASIDPRWAASDDSISLRAPAASR